MQMLEKISKFAGNTFAIWVLLAAGLALYAPDQFTWIDLIYHYYLELLCLVWG